MHTRPAAYFTPTTSKLSLVKSAQLFCSYLLSTRSSKPLVTFYRLCLSTYKKCITLTVISRTSDILHVDVTQVPLW